MSEDNQERRKYPRIHKHDRVEVCCPEEKDRCFSAQVMNKSEGGVRFYSSVAMEEGAELIVKLDGQEHRGRILECAPRFEGFGIRVEYFAPEG